jgi:Tol biopolymer transport system component
MTDSPDGSGGAATGAGRTRLDSWKEIAAYLGRGVTTVQRWENDEGLPVHRLPHAKKGSVFAFTDELDGWRALRAQSAAASKSEEQRAGSEDVSAPPGQPGNRRTQRLLLAGALAAVVLIVLTLVAADRVGQRSSQASVVPAALMPRPIANDAAPEESPSLSPDGERLVFRWQQERVGWLHLKNVAAGPAFPIPFDDPRRFAKAGFATWSPRGDLIAFLAADADAGQDTRSVYVVAPAGGSPRRLLSISGTGLCWSPDGKVLAFTDRTSTGEPFSIFSVALDTGHRQRLTTPPPGTFGDTQCAIAPDGERLVTSRYVSRYQSDLVLSRVDGRGAGVQLTQGWSGLQGLEWTPDGASVVFGSHYGLWEVDVSGGGRSAPVLVTAAGAAVAHPSFSRAPGRPPRLVYQQTTRDVNVWRWEGSLDGRGQVASVAASTGWDDHPALAGDGRVAFASNRTGTNEIWVAAADGSNPQQLTFHNGPIVIAPQWSPDGERIAFSSQVGDNRDIYVMQADGTQPLRLTWETSQEDNPSWSRDGRSIYFRSDRTGVARMWRIGADGGAPTPLTKGAASQAFAAADGTLYFVRSVDAPGLWSMPLAGGAETFLLADVREGFWGLADAGIAFLVSDPRLSPAPTIRFFDFRSRQVSTIVTLPVKADRVSPGFSVAPDARRLVWAQTDTLHSDVMMIDPWRPPQR